MPSGHQDGVGGQDARNGRGGDAGVAGVLDDSVVGDEAGCLRVDDAAAGLLPGEILDPVEGGSSNVVGNLVGAVFVEDVGFADAVSDAGAVRRDAAVEVAGGVDAEVGERPRVPWGGRVADNAADGAHPDGVEEPDAAAARDD